MPDRSEHQKRLLSITETVQSILLFFTLILFLFRTGISAISAGRIELYTNPGSAGHNLIPFHFIPPERPQETLILEMVGPASAILFSYPLALLVIPPERWTVEFFNDGENPGLLIHPVNKKPEHTGGIFFADSIFLQISEKKKEAALEKLFEDELKPLTPGAGKGKSPPVEVMVSRFGPRFIRSGRVEGNLSGRFHLAFALCGNRIIKISALAGPEFSEEMEKAFFRVIFFLLPFRFEKVDARGAIYPAADPLLHPAEEEVRHRYLNFDVYRSWSGFQPGTELRFDYRAQSSSFLYTMEKIISLLALDYEVAVLEYREKGEVKNLASREKLPAVNFEKVLEILSGVTADETSNPYYVSLGPNPLLFLNSGSSLVTFSKKENVTVGGRVIETERVDFLELRGKDEQRASFWFSEKVPGFLVKASVRSTGQIIRAGASEPVEFSQEINLKSFRPVISKEKQAAGLKTPASAPGEVPALYYLQRKLPPGDYYPGPSELGKIKVLFFALSMDYENKGLTPTEILAGLEPLVRATKQIRDNYLRLQEEIREELEEESLQKISGVINYLVRNAESDIRAMELHSQLISSRDQRSNRNAELAFRTAREMIQLLNRSSAFQDDFQNALRALQGVKVKYKRPVVTIFSLPIKLKEKTQSLFYRKSHKIRNA